MVSNVERKCNVWASNQVSKDLNLTITNEIMSKVIDKISVTVKVQERFGQAMSLEKKEARDEIQNLRLKSGLETVEVFE